MGRAEPVRCGRLLRHAVLAACLPACLPAGAEPRPLWEAGAGATALWLADYRGSEESRGYALPIPYFIYRGERLQVDRLGVRGKLFRSDRVELDLNFGGSVPVDSSRNRARAGMPDLDPLLEAGPMLKVRLLGPETGAARLDLRLPVRMALAVSSDGVRDIGIVANPHLAYDTGFTVAERRWNLGLIAGAIFGDRRYHRHFYDVAPAHATVVRPQYAARGGFAGTQLLASVSHRFSSAWVGAFVRYDSVGGAVFESSPLVTARGSLTGGLALVWVLATSSRLVETSD